jgi:hypothetical protein
VKKLTELFENFEVNREPRWPILSRLAAASLVLHAALVASAIYVPGVRNALNIAYMFSDVQYVDEAYTKTVVGERAQIINLAKEKFTYPEGYFSTGASQPDPLTPQIIAQAQPMPVFIPPKPIATPTPVASPTPTPAASPSPQPSASPGSSNSNGGSTGTVAANNPELTEEEKEKKLNEAAAQNNVKRPKAINKRPFVDLLAKAKQMKERGELDLNAVVEMTVEADRAPDGKLSNVVVTQKTGDPKLTELANDLIAALSDSGALDFLEGMSHLTFTLKLDKTDVAVTATTEMQSETVAWVMAKGYDKFREQAVESKSGHDEATIWKNMKVTSNGKQIILSFNMPRAEAGTMLSKYAPAS